MTRIIIPADLPFSALRLARDKYGAVSFDTKAIAQICRASGGDIDPVAEDLIAEVQAEDAAGSLSHQPGRA